MNPSNPSPYRYTVTRRTAAPVRALRADERFFAVAARPLRVVAALALAGLLSPIVADLARFVWSLLQ